MSDKAPRANAPASDATRKANAAIKTTESDQSKPKAQTEPFEPSTPTTRTGTWTVGGMKEAYNQEYDEEVIDEEEYTPPHNSHRQPNAKKCECRFSNSIGVHG